MKQLINLIREDFRSEGFTRREYVKYGIIAPIIYIIVVILSQNI